MGFYQDDMGLILEGIQFQLGKFGNYVENMCKNVTLFFIKHSGGFEKIDIFLIETPIEFIQFNFELVE